MIAIRQLESKAEMLEAHALLQSAYSFLQKEQLSEMLDQMLPHNYFMVAAFEDEKLIAVSGFWIHTKIWAGRILEIDNFVVDENYRSTGIGSKLMTWFEEEAENRECNMMVLDAFVENFKAHKFYIKHGFHQRGYHFVRFFNDISGIPLEEKTGC